MREKNFIRLEEWLATGLPRLWGLVTVVGSGSYQLRDEFIEISTALLRKHANRNLERFPDGQLDRWFLKDWSHLLRRIRLESDELQAELLGRSLFQVQWSIQETSLRFALSRSIISERAFTAIAHRLEWDLLRDDCGPSCVRHDLHMIEVLKGEAWKDPLSLFDVSVYETHLKRCERCRAMDLDATRVVNDWKREPLPAMPTELLTHLRFDHLETLKQQGASGWFSTLMTRLSSWPLPVKLALRLATLCVMIAIVVRGPTLSDLLARFSPVSKKSQSHETPPDAETAVATAMPAPTVPALPVATPPLPPPVVQIATKPATTLAPPPAPTPAPAKKSNERIVFSWTALSDHADADAERLGDLMKKYQVQKGGDLALGAHHKGSRYFHFLVQESLYERLLLEVKDLGFANFSMGQAPSSHSTAADLKRVVLTVSPKN